MAHIEESFKKILREYPKEKEKPFKDNAFAKWIQNDFKKEFSDFLIECDIDEEIYELQMKIGGESWPNLLWINLTNNSIKIKRSKFYIYYLFNYHSNKLELGFIINKTNKELLSQRMNFILKEINSENVFQIGENRIVVNKIHYSKLEYETVKHAFCDIIKMYESIIPKYNNLLINQNPESEDKRGSNERKIWGMNISKNSFDEGEEEKIWEEYKSNSFINTKFLYEQNNIDYSKFKNKLALENGLNDNLPRKTVNFIWRFVNFIKKGDYVLIYDKTHLKAIGLVKSNFIGINKKNALNNFYEVEWLSFTENLNSANTSKNDFFEIKNMQWNKLLFSLSKYNKKLFEKLVNFLYNSFNNYLNKTNALEELNNKITDVQAIFKDLSDKSNAGLDISEEIWEELVLKHLDNDLKSKIQMRENFSEDEMDIVANLFFNTMKKFIKCDNIVDQKAIIEDYANSKYSSKLKTVDNFITLAYYLTGDVYIVNKRIQKTLNYIYLMFGIKHKVNRNLTDYMNSITRFKQYFELMNQKKPFDKLNFADFKNFLIFSEWFGKFFLDDDNCLSIEFLENIGRFNVTNAYFKINLSQNAIQKIASEFVISKNVLNQICASLNAGKHIIFEGSPGTGKTDLAIKFAQLSEKNKFNDGYILTTATSDWSTFDTIGGLMPNPDGSLEFQQGKFLESIAENKWLIIDEINRADIDKAFGPLFTVLSGQNVELPYKINDLPIKIKITDNLVSKFDLRTSTYFIGKNWRILGTMNIDDKDSLFDLSYAFMRRFMFIDIDIPYSNDYIDLIRKWADELDDIYVERLIKLVELTNYRKIGPAIFKDMIEYIIYRCKLDDENPNLILSEAISSYILPQLEGLSVGKIKKIEEIFDELELLDYLEYKLEELHPFY